METLLGHHLATFDGWLQAHLMSSSASSRFHYLAVITLLDQLNPKEYNWQRLSVILQCRLLPVKLFVLFHRMKANIELSRIVSQFLMDRGRARLFWVNSQRYIDLTRDILEFLRDK